MDTDMLQELVGAIPLAAVLVRLNERIEAANDQAQTLLGPNIIRRHFITALRQPALLDAIEANLRDGNPRDTQYLTSDGQQDTTYRVTVRSVPLPSGRGALICFEDVTHLEQIGQMRRDFVANVSHELRTPLTALIGFIETLQGPAKNDVSARERFLGIMQTEAHRMNRLVGDLLSLSRVEADERVRPTQRVDIRELMTSMLHSLAPVALDADAVITMTAPEVPISIVGDQDQLRQVFSNLVENAIKYGGKPPKIDITITDPRFEPRVRGQGIRVIVRDHGPGIDQIHLPRLTERFYRVDSHRSRELGGTGLGLAIVKHIINRHRGRLRIESRAGQGSSFTVILLVG